MKTMKKILSFIFLILSFTVFSFSSVYAKSDSWQQHENLTNRLSSEWYRIGILQNDIDDINDILINLGDFEIYPQSITGLTDNDLINIDKMIESKENVRREIQKELDGLKPALADDIGILREMVSDKPIDNMFTLIVDGDMLRIRSLLNSKHKNDALRKSLDTVLTRISLMMKIDLLSNENTFSKKSEFFEILNANLGLYAIKFNEKIEEVKLTLTERASQSDLLKLYKIEVHQLKQLLNSSSYRIGKRKIDSMISRYKNRLNISELSLMQAKTEFALKQYYQSIKSVESIPLGSPFSIKGDLYKFQSLYNLQKYQDIMAYSKTINLFNYSNSERNLFIWLIIESAIKLNLKQDFSEYIELINSSTLYSANAYHALARNYYSRNEPQIAISILDKAIKMSLEDKNSNVNSYNRCHITKAQILYETKEYDKALKEYFLIINSPDNFEEILFGMSWCYIQQKKYGQAEATLKKLINQSPESIYAAEALLVMAKKFVYKSDFEWKKIGYIEKEIERSKNIYEQLNAKINAVTDTVTKNRYLIAQNNLTELIEKLKNETTLTPKQIEQFYNKSIAITDLIINNYETGSFKNETFSQKREMIMHKLDSLSYLVSAKTSFNSETTSKRMRNNIIKIKSIVKKSELDKTIFLINRYDWEKNRIKREKQFISNKIKIAKLKNDSASINLLSNKIDSLINQESSLFSKHYDKIVNRCLSHLKTDLNSYNESLIRYSLGELYFKNEHLQFTKEYQEYERQISINDSIHTLFNLGKSDSFPVDPPLPILNLDKSIFEYRTVIKLNANDTLTSASRYSLAWGFNDLGQIDSAVSEIKNVAVNYPFSKYAPQAWMYLGEHYFEESDLDNAVNAYKNVMKYPESHWFDDALYKLAWAQYRLSNPEKAISSFLALVDLGKISSNKAMLENESIDYIAISFSESDITGKKGLERAKLFCKKLGDPEKGTKILKRLATVYEEQGRYKIAAESYQTLLALYPKYKSSPQIESSLIDVLARDISLEESNNLKLSYFNKYNRNSDWAASQSDKELIAKADSVAAKQLYDVSVTYHRLALEKNDSTNYSKALSAYRNYIRVYPKSSKTNECHYNLAEILFSTGKYLEAAKAYIAVSKRYPDSKYREIAAWNAIVASQTLLKKEKNRIQ